MFAGFDYGTSQCSLGLWRDGVQLVPLEHGSNQIPSTLYAPKPQLALEREEQGEAATLDLTTSSFAALRFGHDALEAYLEDPSQGFYVKSPKSFLGATGLSEEVKERFITVVAAMMANVRRNAEATAGEAISQVVIGRPINFQGAGGESENQQALIMLVAAAKEAGFAEIAFLYEPMAAALELEARLGAERCVLVVDIGGGTTDCSFVRIGGGGIEAINRDDDILGHAGERVGGNDYDQLLALHAMMPAFGFGDALTNGLPIPNTYFVDAISVNDVNAQQRFYSMRSREQLDKFIREARQPERITRLRGVQRGRLSHRLVRSAEQAKITLSDDERTTVDLGYVEEALDADAQRGQFREGCERLLVHLSTLIGETVDQAGRRPDLVYLTGGMAKATIVREYLWKILGDVEVVDSDHFSSVTEGLTLWARRLFGEGAR
jgi:hypothetical chaperone protein